MRPSDYHRLTFAEKRARLRARLASKQALVACPACRIQTTPGELLRHLEGSCPGRRVGT